jgi:glycosyltransferase involved in cell wall biosynthesis
MRADARSRSEFPELSVVVPARDEEANLELLYEMVCDALDGRVEWEMILVDDGSRDATSEVIAKLTERDARVRGARLAGPCGQSTATFAGVDLARAALIATLDGDLQNDPADLLPLLEGLGDGDAAVGYRKVRRDGLVRRISSRVANAVRNAVSDDRIRDTGCSLKVVRAHALRALPRFEGMHRFLPTLLRYWGYRVVELPVSHHPRLLGRSKYGIRNRALRGFVDLLAVRWMRSRMLRTSGVRRIGRCAACEEWDA